MKMFARFVSVALVCLMLCGFAVAEEAAWMPEAACFPETPDYEYQDESRAIKIERYEKDGIVFFVCDVQLSDASLFRTCLSSDEPYGSAELLSTMAVRSGAVLAINGDDYSTHEFGTIIRNGALIRASETTRNMLIVDRAGDMSVRVDRAGEDPAALGQSLVDAGTLQTFEFGPELVRDSQAVEFSRDFDLISLNPARREPRTAIGQIAPLHYIIIVADGRRDGYSKGMTLVELQQTFVFFGAQTAFNLDGGGSTELWFNGEILNRPCQDRERSVSDIIWF